MIFIVFIKTTVIYYKSNQVLLHQISSTTKASNAIMLLYQQTFYAFYIIYQYILLFFYTFTIFNCFLRPKPFFYYDIAFQTVCMRHFYENRIYSFFLQCFTWNNHLANKTPLINKHNLPITQILYHYELSGL